MANKEFESLIEQYNLAYECYKRNVYQEKVDRKFEDLMHFENQLKNIIYPIVERVVIDNDGYNMRYVVRKVTEELDINFNNYGKTITELIKQNRAYIVWDVGGSGAQAMMKAPNKMIGF